VGAVDVPVTLKFRTGWDRANKNALKIARIAEDAGIAMLTCMAAPAPTATRATPSTTPLPP
jgi:tRNA-dihydrouridine synthase